MLILKKITTRGYKYIGIQFRGDFKNYLVFLYADLIIVANLIVLLLSVILILEPHWDAL
jgi:hypothetical protein